MSTFKRLFSPRDARLDIPGSKDAFDDFMRFSLERTLGQVEPPAEVWKRIEGQINKSQLDSSRSFLARFVGNWPHYASTFMQVFAESSLSERLDERKTLLVTQSLAFPGFSVIGLAIA
jgi:hypothetical protein